MLAFASNILFRLSKNIFRITFTHSYRFESKESQFFLHQNKKSLTSLSLFSFSLDSDRKIRFGMLKDRVMNQRQKTCSGRGCKGKLILILSAAINENSNE
jgi:hypothetical protein